MGSDRVKVQNGHKMSKNRFFEVHESNTTGLLGPPWGSILFILTFLGEYIDCDEIGDPSYVILRGIRPILGPKGSKNVQKSIFRGP